MVNPDIVGTELRLQGLFPLCLNLAFPLFLYGCIQ